VEVERWIPISFREIVARAEKAETYSGNKTVPSAVAIYYLAMIRKSKLRNYVCNAKEEDVGMMLAISNRGSQ